MLYSRWSCFLAFLFCCTLLVFAAYLQLSLGLQPCPLCIIQRLLLVVLALIFLVGSLYTPIYNASRRLHSFLILLFSGLGVAMSGRHVWLEQQPPGQVPSCGASLDYMLQNLPFSQTFRMVLNGSGDCAKVSWQLLGLSIPSWTLAVFLGLLIFGAVRFMYAGGKGTH